MYYNMGEKQDYPGFREAFLAEARSISFLQDFPLPKVKVHGKRTSAGILF